MIQDVEIFNFKCFKSLYLPELSRVNIVAGRNNVGKTSLLEALWIFHDRKAPQMFLKTLAWRGIPRVATDARSVWAPFFHGLDLNSPISMKLKINGKSATAEYKFNPNYSPTQGGATPGHKQEESQQHVSTADKDGSCQALDITYTNPDGQKATGHLYMRDGESFLEHKEPPSRIHPTIILGARWREPPEEEAKRLSAMIENKNEKTVEEFLSIMAPVVDLQISTTSGAPSIICDIGLSRLVPLAYVGDGMTRLLSIILAMGACQGGLILIDEIENGIHHSVQADFMKALFEAAKRFNCQIVATTHSYEFLRHAHGGLTGLFEPEFRYIRLEKNGDQTKAVTFNHEMLGAAVEANLEVR